MWGSFLEPRSKSICLLSTWQSVLDPNTVRLRHCVLHTCHDTEQFGSRGVLGACPWLVPLTRCSLKAVKNTLGQNWNKFRLQHEISRMAIALCRKIDGLNRCCLVFFISGLLYEKMLSLKMQIFRDVISFLKLGYSTTVGFCHLPL